MVPLPDFPFALSSTPSIFPGVYPRRVNPNPANLKALYAILDDLPQAFYDHHLAVCPMEKSSECVNHSA
jgi:hypothetical protein